VLSPDGEMRGGVDFVCDARMDLNMFPERTAGPLELADGRIAVRRGGSLQFFDLGHLFY
jgi:hypothetical protein